MEGIGNSEYSDYQNCLKILKWNCLGMTDCGKVLKIVGSGKILTILTNSVFGIEIHKRNKMEVTEKTQEECSEYSDN